MCFHSTKSSKLRTAKTDIECFKFLKKGKGFKSPIQTFSYKKNVVTELIKLEKYDNDCIYEGYHSFRSILDVKTSWNFNMFSHKICKFIIPAGTRYYANKYHEYVSEQIMLIGNVKTYKSKY